MGHDSNGYDEGPPTKRQRSSPSLDTTMLSASEDLLINGHDTAMDTQTTDDAAEAPASTPVTTPRKRGRPPKQTPTKSPATPSTSGRTTTHLTPLKAVGPNASTPGRNAADRSARRKTARALLSHAAGDGPSDDEADAAGEEDEDLARAIFGDSSDEDDDDDDDDEEEDDGMLLPEEEAAAVGTPTKTRKRRAPTTRRRRARSPTPPRDLPPHETYFFHNKPGRPKTSDNTLAGLRPLTHDEYFDVVSRLPEQHAEDVARLEALHAESFAQWALELARGFGVARCSILARLSATPSASVAVVVHSIDGPALRRGSYAALAALAAHPAVHLACSVDGPDFALLWDVGARSALDLVFHDATTFAPRAPAELDPVDEVHELLGRRARRVHGREGVAFVLRSLPENARNLFRLLVGEVLVAMDEDDAAAAEVDGGAGVEYRMVYNKAVEEFVCSSEMAFRTLLKEFHDHQIITSRKDALGTELLSLPFPREELEAILEDLMA
ncbi:Origin recognition complex, subunit 2 [Cordyceps fumosorosea ARSEF 2679]|uniref:Origin recognition complex subunit 2 n=1 Tax=Cordyceps fumosorosea (strain ARSEF 2679) TaxID=1081104 RepID=A0A168DGI0_CORFA|nr:Origin recognition complex, subunit 2 [Cordyceps fumosorosea ARSEF 2679]OAA72587.1 Origin recognition complex, subunit 2 [Cordyceps fumosorosea ARSEF 2679]